MSNIEKRPGRVLSVIAAAALSSALVAGTAGTASAAVREPAPSVPISLAAYGVVVPAAAQDTTITVLPGITLTINSVGVQLNLTKEAVTEIENVAGFAQSVASLVGSILAVSTVTTGAQIAAIVAAAIGVFANGLRLCTAPDGSATFTILWTGLPSCSGLNLIAQGSAE